MNPARHRPFSAALPHPQQPNTAPHVGLFDDTNGRFVGLSTPPRGNKSDSGDAQHNGGVHSSVRRHHDTTQSPSQSRQRLSPSREFDPGVERTGAAAKRRFRSADAIAFQYYARYQRQRRPGRRSVENEVARSRSATPPPPMTKPSAEAAVNDTSVSVTTSTPRREAATAAPSRPWLSQLTSSQLEQRNDLVETLTQLPSTSVQEVLVAAARQSESRRLLHYYGGVYAVESSQHSATETGAAVATGAASSPPPGPEKVSMKDGRTALLEALQHQMDRLRNADRAAEASSFKAVGLSSGSRQVQACVNAEGSATPFTSANIASRASTASQKHAQEHRRAGDKLANATGSAQTQRNASSGARAPWRLRSRVMANRAAAAIRQRSNAPRDSSVTSDARRARRPVHDFMRTIKLPYRHDLNGAPPSTSTPSSPRTSAARDSMRGPMADVEENENSLATSQHGPSRDARRPTQLPTRESSRSRTHSSPHTTSQEPVRRVLHLSDVFDGEFPAVGPGTSGTGLSPGAAAARRVYWEQQQRRQQQQKQHGSTETETHNYSAQFEFDADEAVSGAASRYPESTSIDVAARNALPPYRNEFESVSTDDSVLRSDACMFQEALTASQEEIVAAKEDATESSALSSSNAGLS